MAFLKQNCPSEVRYMYALEHEYEHEPFLFCVLLHTVYTLHSLRALSHVSYVT